LFEPPVVKVLDVFYFSIRGVPKATTFPEFEPMPAFPIAA
jgi:hypothetical protein